MRRHAEGALDPHTCFALASSTAIGLMLYVRTAQSKRMTGSRSVALC